MWSHSLASCKERKGDWMKTTRLQKSEVITDLDVIYDELTSLIKETENAVPLLEVDDYYKILLATNRIRGLKIEGGTLN